MDQFLAARAQMGTSLAFHIVFAAIGIGLPLMLVIAEGLYLRTKNPAYLALAKKWAKATAILFAVGAVSGTVLSFELGLLWPGFMRYAGAIIGMPFSMEGFAFFIEAIFLGLYLYGRNRMSPLAHWLTTIPLAVSGAASGVFIVGVNAWMNSPSGFDVRPDGTVTNINPVAALFNPGWGVEALHSTLSAYVSVGMAAAAIYAIGLLRGRRDAYHRKALLIALIVAGISLPLQLVSGDLSARFVGEAQPAKLAAMEGQFQTETCAPLRIGGIPDPATHTTNYAISVPCMLSFLAYEDFNHPVKGLDSFPQSDIPNTLIVHPAFQVMVGAGFAMLAVLAWVGFVAWRKRRLVADKLSLLAIAVAGPLGFIALEAGWTVTEVGRQPWVVYGFLRTHDAVTPAPGLNIAFLGFSAVYMLLAVAVVWLLRRLAHQSAAAPVAAERTGEYAHV